ncbi:MAG: hypothetical protein H7Z10_09120 [Gemmatimonadaceae bacterium]|nr:hypothetical protein [Acetobacteraceae bacterium]
MIRGALLASLTLASCGDLSRDSQGILQPQTVRGPCEVKKFYLLRTQRVRAELVTGNSGEACTFTLLDRNLQAVLSAALVTLPPRHGRADAGLITAGRQAAVSYAPQPGYVGPDRFDFVLEPNAFGVDVFVTVQAGSPVAKVE